MEGNISLKLKILHIYWYIILHNPVKRQLKVFLEVRYVIYRAYMVTRQIKVAMAI